MADQVLDITIISAKHIKNVNWRHGDLKPYAIFSLTNFSGCNPTKRTTDSKSIKPVWNEHFVMPLTSMPSYAVFTLSIHHTTACSYEYLNRPVKSLVGTFQVRLCDLPDPGNSDMIRTFDLVRPSGRPNGKVRLKLGVRECALSPPRALIKPSLPWWDPESDLPIPLPDGILIEPQCVVKIKELEDDDDDDDEKSVGKLAPSRWYYKLKKLVYVYIKKRKGPPDPVPIDPKHMWYLR